MDMPKEEYLCSICLSKGNRVVMKPDPFGYYVCPELSCGWELWPPVEPSLRQVYYSEINRPHERGNSNNNRRKRKKPIKRPKLLGY